ncbi:GldG family protein [Aerosticca soli]|uniref:Gliding motility protein GldG n=1 Tax=Aerosticca soli TaxID=2010829 RepID=A0A2Z6E3K0_9GAMM|nr:Gldg family protein [Aerosticca soli]BBD79645.1 gliding motility protein GldG [Aerosticca soli]
MSPLLRRPFLYLALVALIFAYVALALASSHWLRLRRVDLTADQLYTLTPGTVQIIDGLHRPLQLTLYFSAHATRDLPQLRSYAQRVRELLEEMTARSHGRIRLAVVDPLPYSDEEASAEGSGLSSSRLGGNGERVFFGLVGTTAVPGKSGDAPTAARTLVIPFFDPARETFLEYDVAKLLYALDQDRKPRIGILSSLPVLGDPASGVAPWVALDRLTSQFELVPVDAERLTRVDPGLAALLVIHPKHLGEAALYAIDQYVLGGGRIAVFVDPYAELDPAPASADGHAQASDLSRLFAAWGVAYAPDEIVLDRARALAIELGGVNLSHPAMLGLGVQELNHDDAITASLQRINVSTTGSFDLRPEAQTRLLPLIQSSGEAERVPRKRVLEAVNDPAALLRDYHPEDTHDVIAARLRGPMASAFPERAKDPGHRAFAQAEVLLVADTDLLSDRLWVESQSFLGQTTFSAFANNGDFLANLVDNLSGSSALLSIRSRSAALRPFTRVQALQAAADYRVLQKKQELERELAETRLRLEKLQQERGSGGAPGRASEELGAFLKRRLEINDELRDVQHRLNAQIDALGAQLKFIDIVLVPALVALLGLVHGWRRHRPRRRLPGG